MITNKLIKCLPIVFKRKFVKGMAIYTFRKKPTKPTEEEYPQAINEFINDLPEDIRYGSAAVLFRDLCSVIGGESK